jgi:hypothetical protein
VRSLGGHSRSSGHHDASEHDEVRAEFVEGGKTLQGTVGQGSCLTLRLDGKIVTTLRAGKYTVAVVDESTTDNVHLAGSGANRSTGVAKQENATWIVSLTKGVYTYSSDGRAKKKRVVRVASREVA